MSSIALYEQIFFGLVVFFWLCHLQKKGDFGGAACRWIGPKFLALTEGGRWLPTLTKGEIARGENPTSQKGMG